MTPRLWLTGGVALAVVAVAVGALVARRDDPSSWTFSTPSDLPPTTEAPPLDPPPPQVRRRALVVARRDPLVRTLTHGARAVRFQLWGDEDGGLLGADVTFRLPRPRSIDAVLPAADVPPDAPTRGTCEQPYRQTWLREQSAGVTEISVAVDLDRQAVADVSTNSTTGRRSWVEGKPHPSCEAIEGG